MLLLQDIHSSMWMKCFKTSKTKCVMLKGIELTQLISVRIDSDWCTVSVFLCRPDTNTFLVVQESHLHAGECCAQYHSNGHMHCFGMQSMLHKAMTSGAHASGACPLSRTIEADSFSCRTQPIANECVCGKCDMRLGLSYTAWIS